MPGPEQSIWPWVVALDAGTAGGLISQLSITRTKIRHSDSSALEHVRRSFTYTVIKFLEASSLDRINMTEFWSELDQTLESNQH